MSTNGTWFEIGGGDRIILGYLQFNDAKVGKCDLFHSFG